MRKSGPNQALQQTARHDTFLRPIAHRCPAAAEPGRSNPSSSAYHRTMTGAAKQLMSRGVGRPRLSARRIKMTMPTTPIQATDEIMIPLPATEVWPVLADFGGYPRWWPKSLGIRVLSSGEKLLGTEVEIHPFGGRPFRCRVEAVDAPKRIQMRYFGGFIDGFGEWRLEPLGQETRVVYRLEAKAHGWLVVMLGKVLNLAWLHSRSMQTVLQDLNHVLYRKQHRTKESQ